MPYRSMISVSGRSLPRISARSCIDSFPLPKLAALILAREAALWPQASLAQISGLDAASDVVAEAVNDYNAVE